MLRKKIILLSNIFMILGIVAVMMTHPLKVYAGGIGGGGSGGGGMGSWGVDISAEGKDYVPYIAENTDGKLKQFDKLYLENICVYNKYNGWHYLYCIDYFEVIRTDGRVIYDDNGILDADEIINYPSQLFVETAGCQYNYNGAFGTVLNAKFSSGAYLNIKKSGVLENKVRVELIDQDDNSMGSGNYRNSGVNTGDNHYFLDTILTENEDFVDESKLVVNISGTAYWENGWWGGCGDYYTFTNYPLTNEIILKQRDWNNNVFSSNAKQGTYQGKTTFFAGQSFVAIAENLNNYVKVNDIKVGCDAYRDGFHIPINNNGITKISVEDGQENCYSDCYCIIDDTIPEIDISYINDNALDKANYGIVFTDEYGIKSQSVSGAIFKNQVSFFFNDTKNEYEERATYIYNNHTYDYFSGQTLTQEGEYVIKIFDVVGNTLTISFIIDGQATSYNLERLSNQQYKISKWYLVDLPQYMYKNGLYSFATEVEALAFAKRKEQEYFVCSYELKDIKDFAYTNLVAKDNIVSIGEYWFYKSKENEELLVYYFDAGNLNEVIEFYAKKYLSQPQYNKKYNDYGIVDSGVIDNIWSKDFISAYIANEFTFKYLNEYETYKLWCDYVEDDIENYVELEYDKPFIDQVNAVNGTYKIKEIDFAGNEIIYYVYIDTSASIVQVQAKVYGHDDCLEESISTANKPNNSDLIYYYESLTFLEVSDNDEWWTMEIVDGQNQSYYYTHLDTLPCLNDLGNGKFTIKIYDRVGNVLDFIVYILGKAPSIKFNPASDMLSFDIEITQGENYNTILDMNIYKDETLLSVEQNKKNYTFDKSGTYLVELTDNFGRMLQYEYEFIKALPQGVLSVENGNKTNQDVNFCYNHLKYYVDLKNEDLYEIVSENDDVNYQTTLIFSCAENSEMDFEITLVNVNDENNFNCYFFTIDKIIPTLELVGVDDSGTTNDSVSTQNISEENCKVTARKDGVEIKYDVGETLSNFGKYSIKIVDEAGNENTYTFEIRSAFNIGTITILGGALALAVMVICFVVKNRKGLYVEIEEKD